GGWQRQARGRAIQGEVERALAEIEGRAVVAVGAGRTDAGVHALAQVAGVQLAHAIETPALVRAVNAKLPPDIRVLAAEVASAGFHARYAARRKTYRYNLVSGAVASPFGRRYAWHVRHALDVEAMRAAAAAFGGRHDFAAFQAVGTQVASSVRTVRSVSVEPANVVLGVPSPAGKPGLTIDVVGDGFLRHMVRIMVGTLVAVGSGRVPATQVRAILASRSRERAGPTAPPHGLFLGAVDY
ncbi:MAG: tRNA pseudouridine(38-40) synthase TruA, partial [Acidobacteria bacterium]|nr:tRNA pseudouridine(38-40) synthase TruA [Acidobacteriota bacterium]